MSKAKERAALIRKLVQQGVDKQTAVGMADDMVRMQSKVKTTAAAGVGVAAATQSEDSEAGILGIKGFSDEVGRLLQTGYLKPENATDPAKIQKAANKYNAQLKTSPGFARREDIAAMNDAVTKRTINSYRDALKVYTPEDLLNLDTVVSPVKGDQSFIGEVEQIAGVPVSKPVATQGGFQHPAINVPGWRSMYAAAKPFHDKMKKIADVTGKQPVAMFSQMGRESVNFSSPPATIMLDQIQNYLQPDASVVKEFDKIMSARYKDWPGLMDPYAMSWLNGKDGFDHEGKRRTFFTQTVGRAPFRDAGFPLYDDTIDQLNHPLLANQNIGTSGASLFFPDVDKDITYEPGVHDSYDWAIPQRQDMAPGRLEVPVQFEDVYNQTFPEVALEWTDPKPNKQKPKGSVFEVRPYKRDEAVDAIAKRSGGESPTKLGYQPTNEQWAETLNKAIEAEKKRRLKAMGITGPALTAGLFSMTPSDKVLAMGVEPEPTAGGSIADYVKNLPEVLMQSGEDIARTVAGGVRGVVDPKAGVDIMTDPNRFYKPSEEGSAAYNRLNDAFGKVAGAVMDQPFFGALGGPKTGELVDKGVEAYGQLPQGVREVTDRGLMGALAASQILPMKGDFKRNAVSQKTQRGNTVGTAVKANDYLDSINAPKDTVLDYGAGLGENAKAIGATHTFEPFPQQGFEPDFTDPAQVPAQAFSRVVSTNVLNVLPKDLRTEAVLNIGKSLKPGGTALVQTWDLGAIRATSKSKNVKPVKGEENAYITGTGTFQKGFAPKELQEYVQDTLGDLYVVEIVPNKAKLSGVAVTITRK